MTSTCHMALHLGAEVGGRGVYQLLGSLPILLGGFTEGLAQHCPVGI